MYVHAISAHSQWNGGQFFVCADCEFMLQFNPKQENSLVIVIDWLNEDQQRWMGELVLLFQWNLYIKCIWIELDGMNDSGFFLC